MLQTLSFYKGKVREQELSLERFSAAETLANRRLQIASHKAVLQNRMLELIRQSRTATEAARQTLSAKMDEKISRAKRYLSVACASLEACSPLKRIEAGYAYVEDEKGRGISSAESLKKDDPIRLYMRDGLVQAKVETVKGGSLAELLED